MMTHMRDPELGLADRAAEALAKQIGFPDWLSGVGAMPQDDGTMAIEVGVVPGFPMPKLPARFQGFAVRAVHQDRAVAYDRQVAQSAGYTDQHGIPHPYAPGTRYGLARRDNLRRS